MQRHYGTNNAVYSVNIVCAEVMFAFVSDPCFKRDYRPQRRAFIFTLIRSADRLINVFRMLFQPFLACTLKTRDIFSPLGANRPICVHTCPCHKFTLSFRCMNFTIVSPFSIYPSERIRNGHFSRKQTNFFLQ